MSKMSKTQTATDGSCQALVQSLLLPVWSQVAAGSLLFLVHTCNGWQCCILRQHFAQINQASQGVLVCADAFFSVATFLQGEAGSTLLRITFHIVLWQRIQWNRVLLTAFIVGCIILILFLAIWVWTCFIVFAVRHFFNCKPCEPAWLWSSQCTDVQGRQNFHAAHSGPLCQIFSSFCCCSLLGCSLHFHLLWLAVLWCPIWIAAFQHKENKWRNHSDLLHSCLKLHNNLHALECCIQGICGKWNDKAHPFLCSDDQQHTFQDVVKAPTQNWWQPQIRWLLPLAQALVPQPLLPLTPRAWQSNNDNALTCAACHMHCAHNMRSHRTSIGVPLHLFVQVCMQVWAICCHCAHVFTAPLTLIVCFRHISD